MKRHMNLTLATVIAILASTMSTLIAEDRLDAKVHLDNGRYHERYSGNLQKAIEHYSAVLKDPDATDAVKTKAKLGLAACAAKQGKNDEAIRMMNDALKGRPKELARLLDRRRLGDLAPKETLSEDERKKTDLKRVTEKLTSIVIPKVVFTDTAIETVFKDLQEQSKTVDPDKKGVNIFVRLSHRTESARIPDLGLDGLEEIPDPAAEEKTNNGPTATIDFEKIPLGQAIRFLCEQTNLSYAIDEVGVHVFPPTMVHDQLQLRFFPIDPDRMFTQYQAVIGEADDDDGEGGGLDFKRFFEAMGVDFPTVDDGSQASISYDRGTNQLVVRNTKENFRLMEAILERMNAPDPQVLVSVSLLEVEVEPKVISRIKPGDVPAFIQQLPSNRRTVLGEFSTNAVQDKKTDAEEKGLASVFGNEALVHHRLTTRSKVLPDRYTIELDLDWAFDAWKQDSTDAKKGKTPLWSVVAKKKLNLWDGAAFAFKVSSAKPKLKRGAVYLLVRAIIVNPAGQPIRKQNTPDGGWLEVEGAPSQTLER